jgi:hypothetical protein
MTTLRSRMYLAGAALTLGTMSLGMLSTIGAARPVPQTEFTIGRAAAEQKATVSELPDPAGSSAPGSDTKAQGQNRPHKPVRYLARWN